MRFDTFKAALKYLRGADGPIHFFLCEEDAKGKPFIFGDTSKIDIKKDPDVVAVLKTAKNKTCITGIMKVSGETLSVVPVGTALSPSRIEKCTRKAAQEAGDRELVIEVGLHEKEKGSEFEGEDVKKGFRALNSANADDTDFVTDYNADASTSRAKAEGGLLKDAGGTAVQGKKGFVIDPKTRNVHLFEGGIEVENMLTKARRPATEAEKEPGGLKANERLVSTHHSTPLAGKAVGGAGELQAEQGRVTKIADQSGHYKPEADLTRQAVKAMKMGGVALLDDTLVQADGQPATPEQQKHYGLVQALRNKLDMKPNDSLAGKAKLLAGDDHKELREQLQTMALIEADLRKAGVGPSNTQAKVELGGKGLTEEEFAKVKGNVVAINALMQKKYGVHNVLDSQTGADVLQNLLPLNNALRTGMQKVTLGAETFLGTGGDEKAIRTKPQAIAPVKEMIDPKTWEKIKGNRDKINTALEKVILRANFLPPTVDQDVLNNRSMINLVIARGLEVLYKQAEGTKVGNKTLGQAEGKAAVDELLAGGDAKMNAMPEGWELGAPHPVDMVAKKLNLDLAKLKGWLSDDTVMSYSDLAGELGVTVQELYEKVSG